MTGNWGKYNFEGAGPDGPPAPLKIGQVGAVMALPGCVDQTIHADTAHIYTHQTLPAHYFNLFLPALSAEFDNEQPDVGQTAFVLGSHKLETAYDVMVSARGNEELNQRLVRPHLDVGDGLVFDCRILHLGLANRHPSSNTFSYLAVNTHAPPETNADCIDTTGWRPLLYVNYHQPWFVDPKNWNDNERLFK